MGAGYRQRHGYLLNWSLCLLICIPVPLFADDLISIYHLALQQAPEMRIMEADMQAAEAKRRIALSSLLPSLELTAQQSDHSGETILPPPAAIDSYSASNYSLSLSQTLYDGSASSNYDAAQLDGSGAAYLYQAQRQSLMVALARAYFQLLAAQSNMALAKAENAALDLQLEDTRKRYRLGLNTMMEVHETQARFDLSSANVLKIEQQLDTYREQLSLYTGQQPGTLLSTLDNMVLYYPDPISIESWEQLGLHNHTQLKASIDATKAAKSRLSAQKKAHLPTLELGYDYKHLSNDSASGLQQNTQTVGIEFTLPIYSGGETSARIAQARAMFHKAQAEEALTHRRVLGSVRQAYLQLKSNINRVKALRRALMSQQSALKATQVGVSIGKRTNLDLLNARQEMLNARYNYNLARYDYLVGTLELYRSAGILDESRLQMVNNWLQ
ncbi:MAG: TolC family outer membrane protein [Gammaproteobacteria bacterium]|nr:TolC family outer membrane protein [Gammaproteobacteria bacterium]